MKIFECINGKEYIVPDDSCLICKHCTDIWVDHGGPYAVCCDQTVKGDIGKIEFFKEGSNYKLYDDCKLFEETDDE